MTRGPLPTGTVTFLFTDIEGSTRLLQELESDFRVLLERHQELVRDAISRHGGIEVRTDGDAFFCVFDTAPEGLAAAVEIQRALTAEEWPGEKPVRVRIGIHTGVGTLGGDNYVGLDVHRAARITEAAHGGQVVISSSSRVLGTAELPDGVSVLDLGLAHLRDIDEPEQLFQLVIEGLQSEFPPLRRLAGGPTNLPAAASSFVGRDREQVEVEKMLDESRLVTITGVAGAGKSRLAIEVGAAARGRFSDGVWLAELGAVTSDELVAQAVADAIGLQESSGRLAVDVLADYLRKGQRLLILDNCEHVVAQVAELVQHLLGVAPDLAVLATSRQVLGLTGETLYPCPPLAVPDEADTSREDVIGFDAIELFEQRARGVDPAFEIDDTNAATIAAISRRLDGMPLAIELAAALVRLLPPDRILERLDRSFDLLAGGPRSAPSHHQTLRAALESTFELLDDDQQAFARRLGVFVGGFDVSAAEAVAADDDEERDVVASLSELADRSLLNTSPTEDGIRLTVLESVRRFLLDQLETKGRPEIRRVAHAEYYRDLVAVAAAEMRGPGQGSATRRLATDSENIRAALEHWIERGSDAATAMAGQLFLYWLERGEWSVGLLLTRQVLERTPETDSGPRARLLATAGFWASDLGEGAEALEDLEAGLEMARRVEDTHAVGYCSSFLGAELSRRDTDLDRGLELLLDAQRIYRDIGEVYGAAWVNRYLALSYQERGSPDEAIELQTAALETFRDAGDEWNIRFSLALLGEAMHTFADLPRAREFYDESLRGSIDDRFTPVAARALKGLGKVSLAEGKLDEAADHLHEALRALRKIGDRAQTAESRGHLGMMNLRRGHANKAGKQLRDSLRIFDEMSDQGGVAWTLERLAAVGEQQGFPREAATLLAAAERIRDRSGSMRAPVDVPDVEELWTSLGAALSADELEASRNAGAEMTLSEAVGYGLSL